MQRIVKHFFLLGAALDAGATAALLHPEVAAPWLGGTGLATPETLYNARTAAALMAGWTALLLWGAADPLPRRPVLAITAVPVVLGLMIAEIVAWFDGVFSTAVLPLLMLQVVLVCGGLGGGLWRASSADGERLVPR